MTLEWYQHIPYFISPTLFTVGFFSVYWYSVMYAAGVSVVMLFLWRQVRSRALPLSESGFWDMIFDVLIGILVGSRVGYVLFYNLQFYREHPLAIVSPFDPVTGDWTGISGMSYYGGFFGAIIALLWCSRKQKISFWRLADGLAAAIPLGYFLGRLGNFLNGELYGRVTGGWWGMDFGDGLLRHPSQWYEAFFEGLVLYAIVRFVSQRNTSPGTVALTYGIGYVFFRFWLEFLREPDPQLGLVFGCLTISQLLSVIMFLVLGGVLLFRKKIWYPKEEII